MKMAFVCGTRPEVIKLAPVILAARKTGISATLVSSGQHRQMLDQALGVFDLKPDIDLDVMRPNQSLAGLTSRLLDGLTPTLESLNPDVVIVQGDTTTTFVGALASFYQRIPVAHIEAGMRTYNPEKPYPEELNRQMVARLTTWHFPATEGAALNLKREGIDPARLHVTGNTVVDALNEIRARWQNALPPLPEALSGLEGKPLVLVTAHRRENFDEGFSGICQAIATLARQHTDIAWLFPVHLNPLVRKPVFASLSGIANIALVDPVDYVTTLNILARASLVVTDSGGLQEEAPSFGLPVVVMREQTERPEGIAAGFARLVGTQADAIVAAASAFLGDPTLRQRLAHTANPYGNGQASARILDVLTDALREKNMAKVPCYA